MKFAREGKQNSSKKKGKVIIRASLLSLLPKLTLNFPKDLFKIYKKKVLGELIHPNCGIVKAIPIKPWMNNFALARKVINERKLKFFVVEQVQLKR